MTVKGGTQEPGIAPMTGRRCRSVVLEHATLNASGHVAMGTGNSAGHTSVIDETAIRASNALHRDSSIGSGRADSFGRSMIRNITIDGSNIDGSSIGTGIAWDEAVSLIGTLGIVNSSVVAGRICVPGHRIRFNS
jgi:hypothetical protein